MNGTTTTTTNASTIRQPTARGLRILSNNATSPRNSSSLLPPFPTRARDNNNAAATAATTTTTTTTMPKAHKRTVSFNGIGAGMSMMTTRSVAAQDEAGRLNATIVMAAAVAAGTSNKSITPIIAITDNNYDEKEDDDNRSTYVRRDTIFRETKMDFEGVQPALDPKHPMFMLQARSRSMKNLKVAEGEATIVADDHMRNAEEIAQCEFDGLANVNVWTLTLQDIREKISSEDAWCLNFILATIMLYAFQTVFGFLFTIINYIINTKGTSMDTMQSVFYVSYMNRQIRPTWIGFSTINIIINTCFVFVYAYWVRRKRNERYIDGKDNGTEDPVEGSVGSGITGKDSADEIFYPDGMPPLRIIRICQATSVFLFLLGLAINMIVTIFTYKANKDAPNGMTSLLMSVITVVFNFVWGIICITTTRLEFHAHWSVVKKWDLIKTFVFKISCAFTMLCLKHLSQIQSADNKSCSLSTMTDDLLILLITDGVGQCCLKWFGTHVQRWIFTRMNYAIDSLCKCFGITTEELMPVFSSPDEYVELMSRAGIVILATVASPFLAPLAAVIINTAVYWINKKRLISFARPSVRTGNTYLKALCILWFIVSIICIVLPPVGFSWVLSGNIPMADKCTIYL